MATKIEHNKTIDVRFKTPDGMWHFYPLVNLRDIHTTEDVMSLLNNYPIARQATEVHITGLTSQMISIYKPIKED